MSQKSKFKETEIGMIPEDWEELKLFEAIEINPKRELKKGVSAKKVPMDCLSTFNKKIQSFEVSKFSGGSKFINGDTIMARITPCLENGKTAFVDILSDNEVGFGSTEFIVLSGKKGKTTNDFVYYLSISPQLRKEAIKSMTGTSGRQRVQNDLFEDIEIIIPSINEQSAIAKILSDLDSKIELNQQMNKTLEAIGQAIFKNWFVDFEFPDEKGKPYKLSGGEMVDSELWDIPKGWKVKELGEFIEFIKGKKPNEVFENQEEGLLPQILIDVLDGGAPSFSRQNKMIISKETDVLMVMDGASSGRTERGFAGILGSTIAKIKVEELNQNHIYFLLKIREENIKQNTTGTSIPHADKKKIEKYLIAVPPKILLEDFKIKVNKILFKQILIRRKIKNLSQIRDSLLPKLMSGKIRVPVEVRA